MTASLVGLGRRTVTALLTTSGAEFQDWSAAYRLFSQAPSTPTDLTLAHVVQHYVRHWDIEVNFRDTKTLLGGGRGACAASAIGGRGAADDRGGVQLVVVGGASGGRGGALS